jgi:hypothetical protein
MPLRRGDRPKFKRGESQSPLSKHFDYDGSVAVPYTITISFADRPDHEIIHKSMSINWIKALDMALRSLAVNPDFNVEIVPRAIRVQRK